MSSLTCPYFLLLLLGRVFLLSLAFLLGIFLRSPWSPPFPLHALALIPISLAKVRLSLTLTLSHLTIWCSGQTALFLLARAAPASLFPFQQAQYAQVFALCWPRQHQQVSHFSSLLLLSDSRSVLTTLSSPL